MIAHKSQRDKQPSGIDLSYPNEVDRFALESRRIYLTGEIEDDMACKFVMQLQFLARTEYPIYIYISSDGGYTSASQFIIDQMLLIKNKIFTIISGRACSAAAFISAFGTKNHRYITPGSIYMLHPTSLGIDEDYVDQQKKYVDFIAKTQDLLFRQFAKRVRLQYRKIRQLADKGYWLTAQECVEQGFCDGIWTSQLEQEVNIHAISNQQSKKELHRLAQFGQSFVSLIANLANGELAQGDVQECEDE